MAIIRVTKQHQLDKDILRQEIQTLADKLSHQLSASYHWQGERLVFRRSGASGFIDMTGGEVVVEIKLGMLLTPLKSSIENTLHSYLDEHLS